MPKLLENEDLQRLVDYSFGDHSGVLGGVPNAYMRKAHISNDEFIQKALIHKKCYPGKPMTLFIDNIRLYNRHLEYSDWLHLKLISDQDRKWINHISDGCDLLYLCSTLNQEFIIFTAFEDTPLDDLIWDKIPENVLAIHAANGVVFGGKVHPFPHGIERKMHEGYNHHEILLRMIEDTTEPTKGLFVAHRTDTGARSHLNDLFGNKDWATVTHLPYEEYLKEMKNHKFVLCPSGNGIGSSRNWETLYMRRVPVMEDHPYKRELFKDLPVLFVKDYSEVTEELLKANEHLYIQAQEMDMKLLDLDYWFNKCTNV